MVLAEELLQHTHDWSAERVQGGAEIATATIVQSC